MSYPACSLGEAQGLEIAPRSCFGLLEGDRQVLSYPAYVLGGAQGWVVAPRSCFRLLEGGDRQVLSYPVCSLDGVQGVCGGAEIMFRGVRVGVGRCCPTPFVVSAGFKGWVVVPRSCFGVFEGGRRVFADPACSFGGAQGVCGGAEIMFRGVRGG